MFPMTQQKLNSNIFNGDKNSEFPWFSLWPLAAGDILPGPTGDTPRWWASKEFGVPFWCPEDSVRRRSLAFFFVGNSPVNYGKTMEDPRIYDDMMIWWYDDMMIRWYDDMMIWYMMNLSEYIWIAAIFEWFEVSPCLWQENVWKSWLGPDKFWPTPE